MIVGRHSFIVKNMLRIQSISGLCVMYEEYMRRKASQIRELQHFKAMIIALKHTEQLPGHSTFSDEQESVPTSASSSGQTFNPSTDQNTADMLTDGGYSSDLAADTMNMDQLSITPLSGEVVRDLQRVHSLKENSTCLKCELKSVKDTSLNSTENLTTDEA